MDRAVGIVGPLYRGCDHHASNPTWEDKESVPPSSALIYMPLEESSGDLLDWTENDNDASRGTGVTRAEGKVGYGQQGDGSDKLGRTSLTLEQSSASSPGYTMMGWMYIPSGDDGGAICSTSASNTWGWSLASRCDVDRWAIFTGAARKYIGDFVYDTWVHLAGVWDTDDDEVRRYRDGSLYGSALAIGYDAENQEMTIGSTANRPYEDLDGILDEVIMLEGAWSADYIEVYYDMTSDPGSWCQCGAEQPVDASGLALLGLRYYAPKVGRFISLDPVERVVNPYAYVSNRPLTLIDPSGRLPWFVWGILAAAAAIIVECIAHHVNRVTSRYGHNDFRFIHCALTCEISRCFGANLSGPGIVAALLGMTGGTLWELVAGLLEELDERGMISKDFYEQQKKSLGSMDVRDLVMDAIGASCSMGRFDGGLGRFGGWKGISCDCCCEVAIKRLKLPVRH